MYIFILLVSAEVLFDGGFSMGVSFKMLLFFKTILNEKVLEKLCRRKFGWIRNFASFHNWVITGTICSAMRSMISWWVRNFLSFLLRSERTFRWVLLFSRCSFLLALHLDWSLKNADCISNVVCIFTNLFSTLVGGLVGGSRIFSAGFYFLLKCTRGKTLTRKN